MIDLNFSVRGKVTHHKKNRTSVKVEYASLKGFASLNLLSVAKIIEKLVEEGDDSEYFQFVMQNPLTKTGINLRKLRIKFNLESFRKLRRFYKKDFQTLYLCVDAAGALGVCGVGTSVR